MSVVCTPTPSPVSGRTNADAVFSELCANHLNRFEPLRALSHDNVVWGEHRNRNRNGLEVSEKTLRLGESTLSTISTGAGRSGYAECLEDSAPGFVKLLWQRSGQLWVEQDGRACMLGLAQASICDTGRPYRIHLSEGAGLAVLTTPYETFPGWEHASRRICGTRLIDSAATNAAFGALLTLVNLSPEVISTEGEPVLRAVQGMLSTALFHSCGSSDDGEPVDPRMDKARQCIAEHAADPGFCPDLLAAALCMSRRSLYLLFSRFGTTPLKMINDTRLGMVRSAFEDPKQRHRKATDIALDCGFTHYAMFSRLFKRCFGVTPKEFRAKGTSLLGLASDPHTLRRQCFRQFEPGDALDDGLSTNQDIAQKMARSTGR